MDYIHRVGRTGRSNNYGKSITFFTDEDKYIVRKLADLLKHSGCEVPEWIFNIEKKKRKYFKKLIRNPIKRDLDGKMKKAMKDKKFDKEIKKRDYYYYKQKE